MKKVLAFFAIAALALAGLSGPSTAAPKNTPGSAGLVGLSFDDGPDPVMTPYLLLLLKTRGVKATFFVNGVKAQKYPNLIRAIKRDGHKIGNHSWDHPDFTTLTYDQARKQIEDTNTVLKQITGEQPVLFRYPFGYASEDGNQAIRDTGMWEVFWSNKQMVFDRKNGEPFIGDWECDNAQKDLVEYVLGNSSDQAIILLHDGGIESQRKRGCPATHMNYVATAIDKLRKQGYEFGVVETAMQASPVNQGSWVVVK